MSKHVVVFVRLAKDIAIFVANGTLKLVVNLAPLVLDEVICLFAAQFTFLPTILATRSVHMLIVKINACILRSLAILAPLTATLAEHPCVTCWHWLAIRLGLRTMLTLLNNGTVRLHLF